MSARGHARGQVNMCDTKVGGRLGNVESGEITLVEGLWDKKKKDRKKNSLYSLFDFYTF